MAYEGRCAFCNQPVDHKRAAYRVEGVEYVRPGGGTNALHERERVGNWIAHQTCHKQEMSRVRRGLAPSQKALL